MLILAIGSLSIFFQDSDSDKSKDHVKAFPINRRIWPSCCVYYLAAVLYKAHPFFFCSRKAWNLKATSFLSWHFIRKKSEWIHIEGRHQITLWNKTVRRGKSKLKSENRNWKTEIGKPKSENWNWKTEIGKLKSENQNRKTKIGTKIRTACSNAPKKQKRHKNPKRREHIFFHKNGDNAMIGSRDRHNIMPV